MYLAALLPKKAKIDRKKNAHTSNYIIINVFRTFLPYLVYISISKALNRKTLVTEMYTKSEY